MVTNNDTEHRVQPRVDPLPGLLKKKGIKRYGLFYVNDEGPLPDGTQARSGYVVSEGRPIYFFWLGWDPTRNALTLTRWRKVEHDREWDNDPEYYRACEAAGVEPFQTTRTREKPHSG